MYAFKAIPFSTLALLLGCWWVAASCPQDSLAQEALNDQQQAVIAFDVRVGKVTGSELGQRWDVKKMIMENGPPIEPVVKEAYGNLARVFGALNAPADLGALMGFGGPGGPDGPPPVPVDFFVHLVFSDESSAQTVFESLKDTEKFEEVDVDGQPFFHPEQAPENLRVHMSNGTTIEYGTEAYLSLANRNVFTNNLTTAWGKVPDHAVRLAIDIDGVRGLINGAREMAGDQVPPMANEYIKLVDHIASINFSADVGGDELIRLILTSNNREKTADIQGALDSLLVMGKIAGAQGVEAAEANVPGAGAVLSQILKSLNAVSAGDDVTVSIPKPDTFDEVVGNAIEGLVQGAGPPSIE